MPAASELASNRPLPRGMALWGDSVKATSGRSYYRARYYDPTTGRFLREDPIHFGAGLNFYSYVRNNSVNRKDPMGLWQLTIGGGEGLGGMITFGSNNGQWNFGLYTGGGVGGFFVYDPTDSGGCHKFGASGAARAHSAVGLGKNLEVSGDASIDEGSREPNFEFGAGFPGIGGVVWNLAKPHEPPHGEIGVQEGAFAGIGFVYFSTPTQCGCPGK